MLDGSYPYLFYEAGVPWMFQTDEGWAVESALVFDWFETMLPALGLSEAETGDFLDFWTVHLPAAGCYGLYPQPEPIVDQAVGLTITPSPDSLLRLWLVIDGAPFCGAPAEPPIEPFVPGRATRIPRGSRSPRVAGAWPERAWSRLV